MCEPCGPTVAGGFDPYRQQIVLCENNIFSQGHMNDTLTHELVHSYDFCRVQLDWGNLQHLACTEVGRRRGGSVVEGQREGGSDIGDKKGRE